MPLIDNIKKQRAANSELKELEQEIKNIEERNLELGKLITYLESDQFTEEQARLKMNFRGADEEVVVVHRKDENDIKAEEVSDIYGVKPGAEDNNKKISNPARWWRYFFY